MRELWDSSLTEHREGKTLFCQDPFGLGFDGLGLSTLCVFLLLDGGRGAEFRCFCIPIMLSPPSVCQLLFKLSFVQVLVPGANFCHHCGWKKGTIKATVVRTEAAFVKS